MRSRILGTALAMVVLMGSAYANIMFKEGNPGGSFQNVVGTAGEIGMEIHGVTNGSGDAILFTSTIDTLFGGTGAGGTISGASGALIRNVTITAPGHGFSEILIDPRGLITAGGLAIMATSTDGHSFDFIYGTPGGNNYLQILATDGELIRSVTINSPGFRDLFHTRFRPLAAFPIAPEVIPEPSTLGLLGTGMIGLAGLVRRKLRLGT